MKNKKKYIKIFALTLFLMISISMNANVKALTDDNGNEVKCILENTGLEKIANRDFCLTFNREIKPLRNIKDNYTKIILTLDKYTSGNYDGIHVINLIDWLLN